MKPAMIAQIDEQLEHLPPERLQVVFDFVSYLVEREQMTAALPTSSDAVQTMLATEAVLRQDWDRPEEDAAWAHL